MARIRSIKPEFFTSDAVAELSVRARLTWIGLWTYCDDYGRGDGRARMIYAALYPVDPRETLASVSEDLDELSAAGRILRYTVEGKEYLQIINWSEHQRVDKPGKSRIPGPEMADAGGSHAQSSRECRESVATSPENSSAGSRTLDLGTEDLGPIRDGSRETRSPTPKAQRLPDDWQPTLEDIAWSRDQGFPDDWAKRRTEIFRDHWHAEGNTAKARKLDWSKAWKNWLRRDAERAGPARAVPAGQTPTEKAEAWLTVGRETGAEPQPQLRAIEGGSR